jgi:hypothetical protein
MQDRERFWQEKNESHSEDGYDYEYKLMQVLPVLLIMQKEGKLGNVIADIGAGPKSIVNQLKGEDLKLVKIDIAGESFSTDSEIQQKMDVEKLHNLDWQTKKTLLSMREWLEGNNIDTQHGPVVDTMVISDLLNYVDYKQTLPSLLKFIKPGGRVIIVNTPGYGYITKFAEDHKRLHGNLDIVLLLRDNNVDVVSLLLNGKVFTEETKLESVDQDSMICIGVVKELK